MFCITQAFSPDKKAWDKLARASKGVIDEEQFAALGGTISLPFPAGPHKRAAVKVIDPRGNGVMRVHRLPGSGGRPMLTPNQPYLSILEVVQHLCCGPMPMLTPNQPYLSIQPVNKPILCNPYEEPTEHWVYDKATGEAARMSPRRPASYWYKTQRRESPEGELFAEEERDDLPLVNALREDVKRWRQANYESATPVTKPLLTYWTRT